MPKLPGLLRKKTKVMTDAEKARAEGYTDTVEIPLCLYNLLANRGVVGKLSSYPQRVIHKHITKTLENGEVSITDEKDVFSSYFRGFRRGDPHSPNGTFELSILSENGGIIKCTSELAYGFDESKTKVFARVRLYERGYAKACQNIVEQEKAGMEPAGLDVCVKVFFLYTLDMWKRILNFAMWDLTMSEWIAKQLVLLKQAEEKEVEMQKEGRIDTGFADDFERSKLTRAEIQVFNSAECRAMVQFYDDELRRDYYPKDVYPIEKLQDVRFAEMTDTEILPDSYSEPVCASQVDPEVDPEDDIEMLLRKSGV